MVLLVLVKFTYTKSEVSGRLCIRLTQFLIPMNVIRRRKGKMVLIKISLYMEEICNAKYNTPCDSCYK